MTHKGNWIQYGIKVHFTEVWADEPMLKGYDHITSQKTNFFHNLRIFLSHLQQYLISVAMQIGKSG